MLNFTISELLKSSIANKYGINNIPNDTQVLDNLLYLIIYCLQPIRNKINKPVIISSGYRCEKVNKLAGGKANSQHLNGQAADISVNGLAVNQLIDCIINSGVEFDQLINEYNQWVHISYVRGKNRKMYFKII